MTPEVQARLRGLENMLKTLLQPSVGNRKPLKKFKQEVKSVLTCFPSFQVLSSTLLMKGFTDSCLYIKPLPPQTSCNLFSLMS